MAHIKTILVDDFGQAYSVHNYDLGSGLINLNAIESKVEELRPEILGNLSCDLLELEQSSSSEKNRLGFSPIRLKTLNGSFVLNTL